MKRLLLLTTVLASVSLIAGQATAETGSVGNPLGGTGLLGADVGQFGIPTIIAPNTGSFRPANERNGAMERRNGSSGNSHFIDEAGDRESPVVQQEPAFALKFAGTVRVDAQYVSQAQFLQGRRAELTLFDNRRDFSLFGTASSANGLTYGFEIDIGTHRAEMFLMSDYGRLNLGDTASATEALDVGGRTVMVGYGHYALGGSNNVATGSLQGAGVTSHRGQGGTLAFISPNYNGLTIAASYTPESDTDNMRDSGFQSSEDIIAIAGQYTTTYGNYSIVGYAGYEHSELGVGCLTDPFVLDPCAAGFVPGQFDTSQSLFSTGFTVRGMGASFGFGYGNLDMSVPTGVDNDRSWIDLGLAYASGPWSASVGASLLWDEEGRAGGPPGIGNPVDGEAIAISGSFNYILAPGLSIGGGITHHDIDNATHLVNPITSGVGPFIRANTTATVVSLSTLMNF